MKLLLLFLSLAFAGQLAGVTMADSVVMNGQTLVLNGLGLREKYTLDVYVGGLYLPARSQNASVIIQQETQKRVVMHFVRSVSADAVRETLQESLALSPDAPTAMKHFPTFSTWLEDMAVGDQIVIDYVPGKGTSISIKGKYKGSIEGSPFMRAVWGIWLGPTPASVELKQGMLGA